MSNVKSQKVFNLMKDHFHGDVNKVWDWFFTVNASMGYKRPIDFIKEYKSDKLLNYVLNSIISAKN